MVRFSVDQTIFSSQYLWSMSGGSRSLDLSGSDTRHLRLPPLTLSGGDAYAFSVTVVDDAANSSTNGTVRTFTGTAALAIASKGVVARLATKSVTLGAASPAGLVLDGALSADLDNRPGELMVGLIHATFDCRLAGWHSVG